jgi:pheromone shutdown-related protein TraB
MGEDARIEGLPSGTTVVELEGKTVYVVGTAHVSKKSVEDVRAAVEAVRPDAVAIELCEPRYKGMRGKAAWRETNLFRVIKEKKATFLLAQLIMQSFYRRLGKKLETEPGAEMMAGADAAAECGARLELIDRRIDVTLKRVWRHLGFGQRCKLACLMVGAMFGDDEISEEDVEQLKEGDQMAGMMEGMGKAFPQIKKRLIDERDVYLGEKLRRVEGRRVVAVVGAGHVPGMVKAMHEEHDLAELESLPPPGAWSKIWPWLIPVAVVALIAWGFWHGGVQRGIDSVLIWTGVNAALAGLGALLALAHPLTILVAAVAAPFTSLNPTVAAGWVAGLAEAWLRPPKVGDFEKLPEDMETVGRFIRNPVVRILLVVVLTNLGSTLGTAVAIPWIAGHGG